MTGKPDFDFTPDDVQHPIRRATLCPRCGEVTDERVVHHCRLPNPSAIAPSTRDPRALDTPEGGVRLDTPGPDGPMETRRG